MPIVGLSLEKTRQYESDLDPDKGTPEATKWTIKTMDSRVMGKLKDLSTTVRVDPSSPDDEVDTTINMEDVNFQTVQFGVEFENFVDEDKRPIVYKSVGRRLGGKSYQIMDPDITSRIPGNVISELADEVRKSNEAGSDEVKNSDAPSTQPNSSTDTTA